MKNFYDVGRLYIVVYTETGKYVGEELTVISDAYLDSVGNEYVQDVDIINPRTGKPFNVYKGMLRPKNPPPGEQLINEIIAGKLHVNDNVKEIENV